MNILSLDTENARLIKRSKVGRPFFDNKIDLEEN